MSSSGSPNAAPRRPIALFIVLIFAFGLALILGFNVLRVLYGVIAPPLPPLPGGMTEVSHESEAYGADVWSYTTTANPCEVLAFYEAQGGTCVTSPLECTGSLYPNLDTPSSQVGRCHGSVEFSIFHMQWWSEVVRNRESTDTPTILNLEREVFWIGTGPQY